MRSNPTSHITTHRGVDVRFDAERGLFLTLESSDVGVLEASTLAAIKSLIDKAGGKKKMRLPAFRLIAWNDSAEVERCVVTSIIKGRHESVDVWARDGVDGTGSAQKHNARSVFEATTENLAMAAEWLKEQELSQAAQKRAEAIEEKIPTLAEYKAPKL